MTNNLSFLSVIIPCRNEEKFISKCLDSLIAQNYPDDQIEILVIDNSTDHTKTILEVYRKKYHFIKLFPNPKKITPAALNIGLVKSQGVYILRADAHSLYDQNYIRKCLEYLETTDADCVGGILKTLPSQKNIIAQVIANVLAHPFGVGGKTFRTITRKTYVDTLAFGIYRREVFTKIGSFNEKLIRNQDIEFNYRLRKNNGKILLVPEIKAYYLAPASFYRLWQQNFNNGLWNIYTQKLAPGSLATRHFIPLIFVGGLISSLILALLNRWGMFIFSLILIPYLTLNLFFSIKTALKKNIKYLPILPFTFFLLHFSYGLGSLLGILTIWRKLDQN